MLLLLLLHLLLLFLILCEREWIGALSQAPDERAIHHMKVRTANPFSHKCFSHNSNPCLSLTLPHLRTLKITCGFKIYMIMVPGHSSPHLACIVVNKPEGGNESQRGLNVHSNTSAKASSNCYPRKGSKIRMCMSLMFPILILPPACCKKHA